MLTRLLAILSALAIVACSSLVKNDIETQARAFLSSFERNLTASDEVILEQFKVRQSNEMLLQVIRVLQNKDQFVKTYTYFDSAFIDVSDEGVRITLPMLLETQNLQEVTSVKTAIVLGLKKIGAKYLITQFEPEEAYRKYTALKNSNEWQIERITVLQQRKPIYEKAKNLFHQFDSVVFYTVYDQKLMFYVAAGEWRVDGDNSDNSIVPSATTKMGLVDENGAVIIPIEYDRIGTIGFNTHNVVEVVKDGKYGLYNIVEKKEIIPAQYQMIIPSPQDDVLAIVKQDTTYGYYDRELTYAPSLTAPLSEYIQTFGYLKQPIMLAAGKFAFCEIPSANHAASGTVMPPSYLVANQIFSVFEDGIMLSKVPVGGWTEYKDKSASIFEEVADGIRALITSVKSRYVEGREEFYGENRIVFYNEKMDTIGTARLGAESITLRQVDSTLLEVSTPRDWWLDEACPCTEEDLNLFTYYRVTEEHTIRKLHSNRIFEQTEFVKMDSSYLFGEFTYYDNDSQQKKKSSVLTLQTLSYMRNEILASYGFIFPNTSDAEWFTHAKWYKPEHTSVEGVKELMSETDRHNFELLERIIAQYNKVSV